MRGSATGLSGALLLPFRAEGQYSRTGVIVNPVSYPVASAARAAGETFVDQSTA